MTSHTHELGSEFQRNGVSDEILSQNTITQSESSQNVNLSENDYFSSKCKDFVQISDDIENSAIFPVANQVTIAKVSMPLSVDHAPMLFSDIEYLPNKSINCLDVKSDKNETLLDIMAKEIVSKAVSDASEIVSCSPNTTNHNMYMEPPPCSSSNYNNENISISDNIIKNDSLRVNQLSEINDAFLNPHIDILFPADHSKTTVVLNSNLFSHDPSNIFTFNDIDALLTDTQTLPVNEPALRDFPHLPLVDNLFTINIIDSIIGDAFREIKENQLTDCNEEKNTSIVSGDVSSSTVDVGLNLTDVPISPIAIDDVSVEELIPITEVSAEILTDIVSESLLIPEEHQSSEDSANFPVEMSHGPIIVNAGSPLSQEPDHSNIQNGETELNDWSKCNGYLEDEEYEANPNQSDNGERELVTEIVFISETSFMDEDAMTEAEIEDTDTSATTLNPDAPVFIPMGCNERNPSITDSYNPDHSLSCDSRRPDDGTSRFSDFDDRVDISDYEDDGPKSTPSSFSQTFIPTDDECSSSYPQAEYEPYRKDKPVTNASSVTEDKIVETDPELEKQQIEEIHDEIREIKNIAGTLFQKLQLDREEDFCHHNTPVQNGVSSFNFSKKITDADQTLNILTTDDESKAHENTTTQENIDSHSLVDVNLDDETISNNIDNDNAQMGDFEIDEYIGEKYMDHQQIYDPIKYKDYYQICSNVDVPDSPLDMNQDRSSKNLISSRSQSDASSTPPTDRLRIIANQISNSSGNVSLKEKQEIEAIPESLKGRVSEIVLHEADDISDCGSEDIETIGHRYESSEGQKHIYVNQLSLAAELLRTKQNLPYDNDFKPLVSETDVNGPASTLATLQGTSLAGPRSNRSVYENYYGNPCFEMENMQVPARKEVSDSGVQSEESADEADESVRKNYDTSPDKATFAYKNFGAKRSKPMSAMLKGKSDPLCLCCEIM